MLRRMIRITSGNHLRILKYKNIFAKEYALNWSGEVFAVKNINNTVPWRDVSVWGIPWILRIKKFWGLFMISNFKRSIKQSFSRKTKRYHNLHWTLVITLFSKYSFKNTWAFIWTVNWTFMNIFITCLKK